MTAFSGLMSLHGRTALITGAAGGLGRAMADTLAQLGATILLVDLRETHTADIAAAIERKWHVRVGVFGCDLEVPEERTRLFERVCDGGFRVDIMINNAAFVGTSGLEGWLVPFEKQTIDTWRRAIEVNLTAAFDLVKGFAPALRTTGHGSVINIASIYGLHGPDYALYEDTEMGNPAAYAASKGGLIQLTRWLATTMAPDVRVNAIAPGGVFRNQPEAFVRRYEARTPLRRMAREDDFRGAVGFLASDLSAYVTGQVLAVDGGWGIW
jgi:NAD(P)-dependent dehydrogenase (short-subunit alcohol dehydrogenase family)